MSYFSDIADFLLPRRCHLCGVSLSGAKPGGVFPEKFVCASCLANLPRTHYHRTSPNQMEMRFAGRFPFENASGHFFYSHESDVATLIHDFKYRGFPLLAEHMGRVMASELLTISFLSDIDYIVPIPMHFFKQARRGYNQAGMLAKGISDICGVPVSDNLKSVRGHRTQTSFSLEQRLENINGIFTVRHPEEIADKHLLLVDDVCTTGATVTSAATTLLGAAPSARISILTLAVTY